MINSVAAGNFMPVSTRGTGNIQLLNNYTKLGGPVITQRATVGMAESGIIPPPNICSRR